MGSDEHTKARRIVLKTENCILLAGDCIEQMDNMPASCINLIVTSPPYNVKLGQNKFRTKGYENETDDLPYEEYLMWMSRVFSSCFRVLSEDGRICINIGDGKNGKIPTHSDFISMLRDVGFLPLATIIWNKRTTSNRAAWGSFMSPSCPSFPSPFEYVLFLSKTEKLLHKGTPTIRRDAFIDWTNPIWEFPPETAMDKIGHPAVYPVELPRRCIELLSFKEDLVMDPFMGSGTTGIACIQSGRRFVGIEKEPVYYALAEKRINDELYKPIQCELELGENSSMPTEENIKCNQGELF